MRLFTRRVGSGPPVVVLHGGPGASHDYLLPQYDLLATRRSLLYYDQRGGGQSPVPRDTPVGWREHVADLEELREQLGLDRLILCGYSWGGLLAVLYFLEHELVAVQDVGVDGGVRRAPRLDALTRHPQQRLASRVVQVRGAQRPHQLCGFGSGAGDEHPVL